MMAHDKSFGTKVEFRSKAREMIPTQKGEK